MSQDEEKRAAGRRAAELVRDGMTLGLGTGSTADRFLDALAERVRGGLRVRGVPTSERTAVRARALGIEIVTLDDCPELDLAVDGADQVDPAGDLIKGLGGALLREKLVAEAAREFVVVVDSAKSVARLGETCPVPVELVADLRADVELALSGLGATAALRQEGSRPYVTDNGNWILDARFAGIDDAASLELRINEIPGVLENGLFAAMADRIIVGEGSVVREWRPTRAAVGPRDARRRPREMRNRHADN
jgi:ribose 5-phosphate isomerase A